MAGRGKGVAECRKTPSRAHLFMRIVGKKLLEGFREKASETPARGAPWNHTLENSLLPQRVFRSSRAQRSMPLNMRQAGGRVAG